MKCEMIECRGRPCACPRDLGFSLIEVIVVIVVIGIMLAVALPKYHRGVEKSRQAEALTNLAAIRGAQMRFHAETGDWASDGEWDKLDAEEPADSDQYFSYYLSSTADAVASAIRNTNKNCCFGSYTVYIASSGKITNNWGANPEEEEEESVDSKAVSGAACSVNSDCASNSCTAGLCD